MSKRFYFPTGTGFFSSAEGIAATKQAAELTARANLPAKDAKPIRLARFYMGVAANAMFRVWGKTSPSGQPVCPPLLHKAFDPNAVYDPNGSFLVAR